MYRWMKDGQKQIDIDKCIDCIDSIDRWTDRHIQMDEWVEGQMDRQIQ